MGFAGWSMVDSGDKQSFDNAGAPSSINPLLTVDWGSFPIYYFKPSSSEPSMVRFPGGSLTAFLNHINTGAWCFCHASEMTGRNIKRCNILFPATDNCFLQPWWIYWSERKSKGAECTVIWVCLQEPAVVHLDTSFLPYATCASPYACACFLALIQICNTRASDSKQHGTWYVSPKSANPGFLDIIVSSPSNQSHVHCTLEDQDGDHKQETNVLLPHQVNTYKQHPP